MAKAGVVFIWGGGGRQGSVDFRLGSLPILILMPILMAIPILIPIRFFCLKYVCNKENKLFCKAKHKNVLDKSNIGITLVISSYFDGTPMPLSSARVSSCLDGKMNFHFIT